MTKLIDDFRNHHNSLEGVAVPKEILLSKDYKKTWLTMQSPKKILEHLKQVRSFEDRNKEKKGQTLPTAAQFSGAFQWAHKQGITGHGQTAIVMEGHNKGGPLSTGQLKEPSLPTQQRTPFKIDPSLREKNGTLNEGKILKIHSNPDHIFKSGKLSDHHISTTNVLHQIAPDSTIIALPASGQTPLSKHIIEALKNAKVVTHSAVWRSTYLTRVKGSQFKSTAEKEDDNYNRDISILRNLVKKRGSQKLLFQSAGNETAFLSDPLPTENGEQVYWYQRKMIEDLTLQPHTILVGAVNSQFDPTYSSPGQNKKIQDNFLCTLGENVRALSETGYTLQFGTSFSSPIAAGAALLLMEKFPELTIFQIKEVLLESAARSFVRQESDGYAFVYDLDSEEPIPHDLFTPKVRVAFFTPSLYGKGILDLRAALVYGKLLVDDLQRPTPRRSKKSITKVFSRRSPQELRIEMNKILREQGVEAANTIGAWYINKKKDLSNRKQAWNQTAQEWQQEMENQDLVHAEREEKLEGAYAAASAKQKAEREAELEKMRNPRSLSPVPFLTRS